MAEQLEQLREKGQARHDRAVLLGYCEAAGIGSTIADWRVIFQPLGKAADRTWHVWRLGQPPDTAKTFSTVAEVDEYLAHVATFPRYCLKLDGNPRLVIETEEDGKNIRITDKLSGEHFAIRSADLGSFNIRSAGTTQLCVHADNPPTIGDWTQE
jgi:hypothetical protein